MKLVQRTFIPGSRWIYFKLYVGNNTADKVLSHHITYIINNIKKKKIIDKWFFVRYSDSDFHIRIRILLKDEAYIGEVINLFYKRLRSLVQSNLIWKMQLDTYNRELERYSNKLIEVAESIFFHDSECTLSIIKKLENEDHRWMISLKMIDSLLTDFSFDITSKLEIMEQVSNSFKIEFGFNQYNCKQLNTKYRENKRNIENVFNDTIKENSFRALYIPIYKRSKKLIPLVKEFNDNFPTNKNDLILSYIHMMLNRLFHSKNRLHELVLYDFMKRYYTSEKAKSKYNN
ncbi:thiopeptide-type bacteriocin biosynthesis protein [Dysgonomonas sp. HGC4]|uniref:thiopeptide-type bacteriocin biosynthesis protein n=2 Tax=Dysgonomonas sp. HGC4 TaxID=1658009 RepID=UPI001784ED8B|nr:thiopeptide-type bacteriocin biosynthesis protein [Dysgonomonas sp. HGC4]MBD8348362.1 hypothetical protein [Dysgonomonas sp. HGC4]